MLLYTYPQWPHQLAGGGCQVHTTLQRGSWPQPVKIDVHTQQWWVVTAQKELAMTIVGCRGLHFEQ